MHVDLRRRRTRTDLLLLTCRAIGPALVTAMTAVSCSGPAADMPERRQGVVAREPSLTSRAAPDENRAVVQRKSETQQTPAREAHGSEPQRHVAKVSLPYTNGVSPSLLPRRSERTNTASFTQAEKEQLFREFLQWRKQREMP